MYIFTYGTLMQGYGNWDRLLRGRSEFITKGILSDFKLYDSSNGGFPVADHSVGDSVYGDVFLIDEDKEISVLRSLDNLEGYIEDIPEISMYHRTTVDVLGDDGLTYNCQTYQGNSKFWGDFQDMWEIRKNEQGSYSWSR